MRFRTMVRLVQLTLLVEAAGALALAYLLSAEFRDWVGSTITALAQGDVTVLREYLLSFGAWAPAVSLLAMVVQALAAPVPASLVVLANGMAFGAWWGSALSLVGQALAATVCFWIARAVGRTPIEALTGRLGLESADRWVQQRGTKAIVLARLIPGIGFDAVSYAAGLTRIDFRWFLIATVTGSVPQTLLYAYLGQAAPRYFWALLALSAVVLAGIATTALIRRHQRRGRPAPRDSQPAPSIIPRAARLPVTAGSLADTRRGRA